MILVVSWLVIVPPGAGADEGSHLVRSGAVVRGELSGADVGVESLEAHVLPDSYEVPDTCYAFRSDIPVSCAPSVVRVGASVVLPTRADEYQIWPHLVYGLPTLLPGPAAIWWARLIGVLVVVALVGGALITARSETARAGILVALTPMALGTFATVNPSVFAIAGGIAVWSVVSRTAPWSRAEGWLLAAGWVAMSLSRRDGLVWAVLVIILIQFASGRSNVERWRGLGWGPRLAVALSTTATVAWGLANDSGVSRLVALSPVALLAAEVGLRCWHRWPTTRHRSALAAAAATGIAIAIVVALRRRPGGWDADLARAVVEQTGTHLVEAIGVLGWLDTPMPWFVIAGWCALVGVLAAGALAAEARAPVLAAAVVVLAVGSSWVFELLQGNTTGRYWQGRYSLPLLVGIPIVLAAASRSREVTRLAGGTALMLLNVALWSAARRWAVGIDGPLAPWRWDTPHTPFPTLLVLVAHAVVSVGLAVVLVERGGVNPNA